MPPAAATENRLATAILAELVKIGVAGGAGAWLTAPAAATEGVPGDPIPNIATSPRLYLQFLRTTETEGEAGTAIHRFRVTFFVWCVAKSLTVMASLKADVLRALWAAESTFAAAFGQPVWARDFQYRDELRTTGGYAGALEVFIDVEFEHAAP